MRYITNRFDKGIVRSVAANIAATGTCDEIINLRQKSGQLKVVGKKKVIIQGVGYAAAYRHRGTNYDNTIVIDDSTVKWLNEEVSTLIYSGNGDVSVSFINNLLIINDSGAESLTVYIFRNGAYALYFDKYPALPGIVAVKESTQVTSSFVALPTKDITLEATKIEARNTLIALLNECRRVNDNRSEGYMLVALSFTLFDGSETKMSAPVLISLTDSISVTDATGLFFFMANFGSTAKTAKCTMYTYGLKLSFNNIPDYSNYHDLIKSINIYVTNPVSSYNATQEGISLRYTTNYDDYNPYPAVVKRTKFDKSLFENQLFYKSHSISILELSTTAEYTVRFGDYLPTGKTMPVDSTGWISTTGTPFVYNNRLHLYNIQRTFAKSSVMFNALNNQDGGVNCFAYIYIKTESGDKIIKGEVIADIVPISGGQAYGCTLNPFVSFPDSRAYKAVLEYATGGNIFRGEISLISSQAYNYAYAIKPLLSGYSCTLENDSQVITESLSYSESGVIIVSEQNNPAFFNVLNSYKAPGSIYDLAIMSEQISETQTGQFPVFVFTDEGIFALQQGAGVVLYSALIPINSDRVINKVVQTASGIAYIANGKVYLLAGRQQTAVSAVLEGQPDSSIRNNESYQIATSNSQLCVSSILLSQDGFEDYIKNAILLYNESESELIVSSATYNYSYVYSINSGAWHKISEVFVGRSADYSISHSAAGTVDHPATKAKAYLTFQNYIASEQLSFNSLCRAVIPGKTTLIPPGQVVLKLNTEVIGGATLQYATPLYMVLSHLLRANSNYAVSVVAGVDEVIIYSDNLSNVAKTLTLQLASGTTYADDFEAYSATVTIARKAIGEVLNFSINGVNLQYTINALMSLQSLMSAIQSLIQASAEGCTVSIVENTIVISANIAGPSGNLKSFSATGSQYCIVTALDFAGGAAAYTETVQEGNNIVDIATEEAVEQLIHLQTRPFSLENSGYKNIKAALRGIIKPGEEKVFGAYIFASNDLKTWDIVEAGQTQREFTLLKLQRSRSSYRYFVLVAAGTVGPGTEITHLDCEIHDKFQSKLR